jgi:hypothetical protein
MPHKYRSDGYQNPGCDFVQGRKFVVAFSSKARFIPKRRNITMRSDTAASTTRAHLVRAGLPRGKRGQAHRQVRRALRSSVHATGPRVLGRLSSTAATARCPMPPQRPAKAAEHGVRADTCETLELSRKLLANRSAHLSFILLSLGLMTRVLSVWPARQRKKGGV